MNKYDFIIIGSGFGGSVSAMRLSQKGYKVLLLEKGKEFTAKDFPKTNWQLKKYIWAPLIRLFGIQQITLLNKVMILHGVGVGGGSLVYANTLMRPLESVLKNPLWPKNFSNYYDIAQKMLGVTKNKIVSSSDLAMKKLADQLSIGESYHLTDVGVYFDSKNNCDPYFSGDGPLRNSCTGCGACMIGCPVGAKNSLDKNYLFFAKKWGCEIKPEKMVSQIIPNANGYDVHVSTSTQWFSRNEIYSADHVILAAGVLGTLKILFQNKFKFKTLPQISDCLGQLVRTNGESLCGATAMTDDIDYSKGIAIGSAIHPDQFTKIEPVRYPAGSDFMRLLAVPLTGDGNALTRPLKLLANIFLKFPSFLRLQFTKNWAKKTIILLVMQSLEEKMTLVYKRSVYSFFRKSLACDTRSNSVKSYMSIAQDASQKLADIIVGVPQNGLSEVVLNTPATAHILGGCIFGDSSQTGVINHQHEVFGYKNLFVTDGSVIPVNLGVNPSLTITAISESFCSQFEVSKNISNEEYLSRQIKFSN